MQTVPLEPTRSFESPLHSQGVLLPVENRLAIISGQVGVRPDGTVADDVGDQTRTAFENITRILAEARMRTDDIASLRIYLTSHNHVQEFIRAAKSCLGNHRPAATLLIVAALANPSLQVQIEATAVGPAAPV